MVDNTASHIKILPNDETDLEKVFQADGDDIILQTSKRSKASSAANLNKKLVTYQGVSDQDLWSSCNMNKQRVIEAKPTLLTPKSASKIYGTLSTEKPKLIVKSKGNVSPRAPAGKAVRYLTDKINGSNSLGKARESLKSPGEEDNEASALEVAPDAPCDEIDDSKSVSVTPDFSHSPRASVESNDLSKLLILQHSLEEQKSESIQISPTISFPVSRISNEDLFQSYIPPSPLLSFEVSSVMDDMESLDHSSDVSGYSYSSSMLSQEVASNAGLHNLQHKPTDQILENSQSQHEDCQKEINELKQSLKLAEADTAILVSSKQQLQLDNQDLTESVKYLNLEVSKLRQNITEKDVNLTLLKQTSSTTEKKSAEMLLAAEENLSALQMRLDEANQKLDKAMLEKEELKNQCSEIFRNFETATQNNQQLDTEIKQLLSKCVELESLANSTAIDKSDNNVYINSIRSERDEYAVKLHNVEQDARQKQLVISKLEERINSMNEKQSASNVSQQNMLQSLQAKEALVKNLQSQLVAKDKEKEALDDAINRLHGNLFRVEASFSKIKKEMTHKAMASQQEATIKRHFEGHILSLKNDLKRVQNDCKNFTQKIGDKNNQISQLSEQLKRTLLLKKQSDSEAKKIKSEAVKTRKSWENAVAREKQLSNSIEIQSKDLESKVEALAAAEATMSALRSKQHDFQAKIEEIKSELQAVEEENHLLKNELGNVHRDSVQTRSVVDKKNNRILELESQIQLYAEETSSLNQQLENLKCERETKQLGDAPDEELANVVSQLQASRREIFEQNSLLDHEIKALKEDLDKIKNEKLSLELKCNEWVTEQETWSKNENTLNANLIKLSQQLESSKKNVQQLTDDASLLEQKCTSLENELVAGRRIIAQYESDLEVKVKEHAVLSKSNGTLNEELETAKKEMNSANLKIFELINTNQETKRDRERIELFERLQEAEAERSKLNEAVIQQQRYIASLQAHYQKWVHDATLKFEELQIKQETKSSCDAGSQTNQDELRLPSLLVNAGCQTSHEEMPLLSALADAGLQMNQAELSVTQFQKSSSPSLLTIGCQTSHEDMVVPSRLADADSQTNEDESAPSQSLKIGVPVLVDSGCQTSHDEMVLPAIFADASSQTDHVELSASRFLKMRISSFVDSGCQTSHEEMAIPSIVTDASSQTTQHELPTSLPLRVTTSFQLDAGCQTSYKEMTTPSVLADAGSQTDRDELVHHKNMKFQSVTDTGSQTSHENMVLPSLLADAGSQTDHNELIQHENTKFPPVTDTGSQTSHENMVLPSLFVYADSQTDHNELSSSRFWKTGMSSLIDSGCQTNHEEMIVPSVLADASSQTKQDELSSSLSQLVAKSVLFDAGCQTSHEEMIIPSVLADADSQTSHNELIHHKNTNSPAVADTGYQTDLKNMVVTSLFTDAGSQTDHNEVPLSQIWKAGVSSVVDSGCQTNHEEMVIPSVLADAGSQTDHNELPSSRFWKMRVPLLVESGCQTTYEEMVVPSLLADASFQTNQDALPTPVPREETSLALFDAGCQTSHEEIVLPSALIDFCSQTNQDELLTSQYQQETKPALLNTGCQTSHEDVVVPSALSDAGFQIDVCKSGSSQFWRGEVPLLVESGCQTSHEEMAVPSILADAGAQTNHVELPYSPLLKVSKSLVDIGCQTSHDEMPLPSSPLRQVVSVLSVQFNDSWTQTSHDPKPLSPNPVKNMKNIDHCSSCGKPILMGPYGDKTSNESYIDSISKLPQEHNTVPHPLKLLQMDNFHADQRIQTPSKSSVIIACQANGSSSIIPNENHNHCDAATETMVHMVNNHSQTTDNEVDGNAKFLPNHVRDAFSQRLPLSSCDVATQIDPDLSVAKSTSQLPNASFSATAPCITSYLPAPTQNQFTQTLHLSSEDTATQTVQTGMDITHNGVMNGILDEDTCSLLGQNVQIFTKETRNSFAQTNNISMPQFPDPTAFLKDLNSEDRSKLKAYKQTVKVVRGKLKQAEKQLAASQEAYSALKLELETLRCKEENETVPAVQKSQTKASEQNIRWMKELESLEDANRKKDFLIESLQNELEQIKKRHTKEKEKIRRKSKADKMIRDKKTKEVNDRLKMLVDANERLRKNVEKLQVKLTNTTKQLESCQREKLRYQHRARKLQADLRSLSWLSSSPSEQDKADDNSVSGNEPSSSYQLPPSVHEIDCILKDLRKEIGVLEEQLQHHSSAVYQSNASLKELRGLDSAFMKLSEDDSSQGTGTAGIVPSSEDTIGQISEIV